MMQTGAITVVVVLIWPEGWGVGLGMGGEWEGGNTMSSLSCVWSSMASMPSKTTHDGDQNGYSAQ